MKMHRALSLTALAVAGALCAAPSQGWAQTVTAAAMEAGVTVQTVSSATVTVKGTVSGQPESVSLSGSATLESKVVWSEIHPGSPATIRLDIDLSGVSGVGASTKKKYVTAAREIAQRTLSTTDLVEFTFPFYVSGATAARTGLARFSLMYDVNTGALQSVSGTLSTP